MSNGLTTKQLLKIQELRVGSVDLNKIRPVGESIADWMGSIVQVEKLVFIIGAEAGIQPWEWLINSPYQVKLHNHIRVEFLEAEGAVAFKLMFVKGPRDASSDRSDR